MNLKQDLSENYRKFGADYFVKKYDKRRSYIYTLVYKLGVTRGPIKTKKLVKTVIKLYYDDKMTIKQIRKTLDLSKSTIMAILKKYGQGGRKRNEYNNNLYQCNESFFSIVDCPEKAYWFGFIAADGNLYNNKLQICLHSKDLEHLKSFCKRIQYTGPFYNDRGLKRLVIARKKVSDDLKKLGLIENKTFKIDEHIFDKIPPRFTLDAILGYFDGDGSFSIRRDKKYISFNILGNYRFLVFLMEYLNRFGLGLSSPKHDKRTKRTYYLSKGFNKEKASGLKNLFYKETLTKDFLKRKRDKIYEFCT